ncbi:hypothetical protein FOA52_015561 [Chlamydomonas sp. UWO 241]|nr:hypothetical protein FOA52_015561 [Chlamydomonas sp. UWO 241]
MVIRACNLMRVGAGREGAPMPSKWSEVVGWAQAQFEREVCAAKADEAINLARACLLIALEEVSALELHPEVESEMRDVELRIGSMASASTWSLERLDALAEEVKSLVLNEIDDEGQPSPLLVPEGEDEGGEGSEVPPSSSGEGSRPAAGEGEGGVAARGGGTVASTIGGDEATPSGGSSSSSNEGSSSSSAAASTGGRDEAATSGSGRGEVATKGGSGSSSSSAAASTGGRDEAASSGSGRGEVATKGGSGSSSSSSAEVPTGGRDEAATSGSGRDEVATEGGSGSSSSSAATSTGGRDEVGGSSGRDEVAPEGGSGSTSTSRCSSGRDGATGEADEAATEGGSGGRDSSSRGSSGRAGASTSGKEEVTTDDGDSSGSSSGLVSGRASSWSATLVGARTLQVLTAVNTVLFERHGYAACNRYGMPCDAQLSNVMESGKGGSAALSILYLEVCARLGLTMLAKPLEGGRYFVLWPASSELRVGGERLVVDPYGGGGMLMASEVCELFDVSESELWRPAARRALLAALLCDLRDAHWARARGCSRLPASMTPLSLATALEPPGGGGGGGAGRGSAASVGTNVHSLRRATAAARKRAGLLPSDSAAALELALLHYFEGNYDDAWLDLGVVLERQAAQAQAGTDGDAGGGGAAGQGAGPGDGAGGWVALGEEQERQAQLLQEKCRLQLSFSR